MSAIISSVSWAPVIASSPGGNVADHVVAELRLAGAVGAGDPDRRGLAGPADERGDGLAGERGERRRSEAVDATERGEPDDDHVDRLGHLHDRLVADLQVAVLGGRAVDHDLVRLPGGDVARRAPFVERPRVHRRVTEPVRRRGRRAVAADRLTAWPT